MSRGTKSFKTKSGRIFKVSRELFGDDQVAEKILRNLFIQSRCFQISLDKNPVGQPELVLEATKTEYNWTIPDYDLRLLNDDGEIEGGRFCPKNERTCIFFPTSDVFKGITFAISGRGQRWYKKEILRPFITLSGGNLSPTIRQNVDFLILARSNLEQENAKIRYAERNGIRIISPRELMAIWFSEYRLTHSSDLKAFFQTRKLEKEPASVSVQSSKKLNRNQNESW
jgi:hypothetical protein